MAHALPRGAAKVAPKSLAMCFGIARPSFASPLRFGILFWSAGVDLCSACAHALRAVLRSVHPRLWPLWVTSPARPGVWPRYWRRGVGSLPRDPEPQARLETSAEVARGLRLKAEGASAEGGKGFIRRLRMKSSVEVAWGFG